MDISVIYKCAAQEKQLHYDVRPGSLVLLCYERSIIFTMRDITFVYT